MRNRVYVPTRHIWCLLSVAILLFLGPNVERLSATDDWPQFLGPHRNGISAETGLINTWPQNGLPVVWRTELGVSMSGIAIVGDRLFTLYQDEQQQYAVCLNAKNGELIWKQAIAPAYRNQMGNGPRATPTVSQEQVFVFSGEGILVALNAKTGEQQWSANPVAQLGGKQADYGMACSPLVIDDRVVVTAGAPQGTLVAYRCDNGELAWKVGEDRTGYSSPNVLTVNDQPQLVALTGNSVLGVAPDSGKTLWRYPFETDYDCNTASPIGVNGKVFVSAGENHGCVMLKVTGQDSQAEVTVDWESLGRNSVMRNEWQTSILWDGYLYGLDNVGSAGAVTHLNCVNAKNGDKAWQETRFGKSNFIAADGKLFGTTMEGEIFVVQMTPERFQEIGRMQVMEATRQAPALSNGLLYVRDDHEVICLSVKSDE